MISQAVKRTVNEMLVKEGNIFLKTIESEDWNGAYRSFLKIRKLIGYYRNSFSVMEHCPPSIGV